MNFPTLLVASLLTLGSTAVGAETPAPASRLRSEAGRAAQEEFVAEVLAVMEEQAAAYAALGKDVSGLNIDQVRTQLAFLETLATTRTQISHSRRTILGCAALPREDAELLLGELNAAKARWDKLLAEELPARKAALNRQLEIAAVAVMAHPSPPPQPAARTPAEILAAARLRIRPNGIASIGGEYQLMLDGQRMRAGQTIKVKLDREYTVTLSAVSKNSFTLAHEGQTLVVPMD